jgi:hypothetical protein
MHASIAAISSPSFQPIAPSFIARKPPMGGALSGLITEPAVKMARSLLLYGHEAILLETRSLILRRAGFKVFPATNSDEALHWLVDVDVDALVVCQTVPHDEASGVISTARVLQSSAKSLVLLTGWPSLLAVSVDETHNTFDGPRVLIAKIQKMLH